MGVIRESQRLRQEHLHPVSMLSHNLLLLPFLVMVVVTAAAAVWASHRQLSRTTLQYASHSPPLQRQHMLFECLFCFLLRCLCVAPFTCDGRATGQLVLAHSLRRARPLLLPKRATLSVLIISWPLLRTAPCR